MNVIETDITQSTNALKQMSKETPETHGLVFSDTYPKLHYIMTSMSSSESALQRRVNNSILADNGSQIFFIERGKDQSMAWQQLKYTALLFFSVPDCDAITSLLSETGYLIPDHDSVTVYKSNC